MRHRASLRPSDSTGKTIIRLSDRRDLFYEIAEIVDQGKELSYNTKLFRFSMLENAAFIGDNIDEDVIRMGILSLLKIDPDNIDAGSYIEQSLICRVFKMDPFDWERIDYLANRVKDCLELVLPKKT